MYGGGGLFDFNLIWTAIHPSTPIDVTHHTTTPPRDTTQDFTMGASFGFTRQLAFKHVASGQVFEFPQGNGDVFAFTSEVVRTTTASPATEH